MFNASITRHIPRGKYFFDEATVSAEFNSHTEALTFLGAMQDELETIMPRTSAESGDWEPPRTEATITPCPAPAPQFTANPPTPLGVMALPTAEAMISPCGESAGIMLASCSDEDLRYLSTKYKKDQNIRSAAAIVLAARLSGQTVRR